MRFLCVDAAVLSLIGCATPFAPKSNSSNYRASLASARAERDARERRLSEYKLQDEIDRLTKEIRELELRISELEWQVEDAERRQSAASSSAPSSSGCYTGSQVGRYTITSSDKKNYGGC